MFTPNKYCIGLLGVGPGTHAFARLFLKPTHREAKSDGKTDDSYTQTQDVEFSKSMHHTRSYSSKHWRAPILNVLDSDERSVWEPQADVKTPAPVVAIAQAAVQVCCALRVCSWPVFSATSLPASVWPGAHSLVSFL